MDINNMEYHEHIDKLLEEYLEGDELEIRFGYFKDNYFKSFLSHRTISNLLLYFRENSFTETYKTSVICMYNNGIRRLIYDNENYVIKKTKKNTIDIKNLNVRICLSKEKVLDDINFLQNMNWQPKIRKRTTFICPNNSIKIDITSDILSNGNYQNQCEVEFITKPNSATIFNFISLINNIINS